jgi:hypothetical protein
VNGHYFSSVLRRREYSVLNTGGYVQFEYIVLVPEFGDLFLLARLAFLVESTRVQQLIIVLDNTKINVLSQDYRP